MSIRTNHGGDLVCQEKPSCMPLAVRPLFIGNFRVG